MRMSEDPVYVFKPKAVRGDPTRKRRRVELEDEDLSLDLRRKTFESLWPEKQQRIEVFESKLCIPKALLTFMGASVARFQF